MLANFNVNTGLPFGVISGNSLDSEVMSDLFYGVGSRNLSEDEAYDEEKKRLASEWDDHLEQADIAAAEVDPNMSGADYERFIEKWFEDRKIESDKESYVSRHLEEFGQYLEIECPIIEGEADGVRYRISWLGGAPLVWSLNGPAGTVRSLCSPCVPGAGDLDSGFVLDAEEDSVEDAAKGFRCHCVPREWLGKEG